MTQRLCFNKSILDPETGVSAISWNQFKQLLGVLEYGCTTRVMLLMLAYTGCRVSELEKFLVSDFVGNTVWWRPGKNQKGKRKETLPDCYLEELKFYRASHKVYGDKLFGAKASTFRTKFCRWRQQAGGEWLEKESIESNLGSNVPYKLKLKGFRKTFQTVLFKYYYEKYNDHNIALGFVSKRMRHSTVDMTLRHYIDNYEKIGVVEWVENFYCEKPSYECQTRLGEFEQYANPLEKRNRSHE